MKISFSSIFVPDQDKALDFYTRVLGFQLKHDIPMGPARWLTVVSPEAPDGVELVLEPLGFPPAADYQKALFEAGIPVTAFEVQDIEGEYNRLSGLGVEFASPPAPMGPTVAARLEDGCGNLLQIFQVKGPGTRE